MDVIVLDDDTSDSEPEAALSYAQSDSVDREPAREPIVAAEPAEDQPITGFSNSTAYMDAVRSALAMAAALDKKDSEMKPKRRGINKTKQPRKQAAPSPPRPFSDMVERYAPTPAAAKSRAWVKKRERPRSVPFKTHALAQQREYVSYKTLAAAQGREYTPSKTRPDAYRRTPERERAVPIDITSSTSVSSSELSSGSSSSLSSDSESCGSSSSLSATPAPRMARLTKQKRKLASPKRPRKSYRPVQESKSVLQPRQFFKTSRLDRPRAVEDLMLKGLNSFDLRKPQHSASAEHVGRPLPPNSYLKPKSHMAPLVARKQLMSEYNLNKSAMGSVPAKPAASMGLQPKRVNNKEKVFSRLKKHLSVAPRSEIPSTKICVVLSSSSSESESASSSSSDEQNNERIKRMRKTPFHTDHVALDEVQAQERELARFQAQKKQELESVTTSLKSPSTKSSAVNNVPDLPRVRQDEKRDAVIELNSDVDMSDGATMDITLKVPVPPVMSKQNPKRTLSLKNVCHSTAFRRIYFDEAPSNILHADARGCRLPYAFQSDHRLTTYGKLIVH